MIAHARTTCVYIVNIYLKIFTLVVLTRLEVNHVLLLQSTFIAAKHTLLLKSIFKAEKLKIGVIMVTK